MLRSQWGRHLSVPQQTRRCAEQGSNELVSVLGGVTELARLTSACSRRLPASARPSLRLSGAAEAQRSASRPQEEGGTMSPPAKTPWRIAGEEIGGCNCAWGCPCQFNALPTHGRCEGLGGWQIREGYFGTTRLDGVRFARIFWWPGPIHEGNGTRQLLIDEQATPDQRTALLALESGTQGGAFFEIFAAVCP